MSGRAALALTAERERSGAPVGSSVTAPAKRAFTGPIFSTTLASKWVSECLDQLLAARDAAAAAPPDR